MTIAGSNQVLEAIEAAEAAYIKTIHIIIFWNERRYSTERKQVI